MIFALLWVGNLQKMPDFCGFAAVFCVGGVVVLPYFRRRATEKTPKMGVFLWIVKYQIISA